MKESETEGMFNDRWRVGWKHFVEGLSLALLQSWHYAIRVFWNLETAMSLLVVPTLFSRVQHLEVAFSVAFSNGPAARAFLCRERVFIKM